MRRPISIWWAISSRLCRLSDAQVSVAGRLADDVLLWTLGIPAEWIGSWRRCILPKTRREVDPPERVLDGIMSLPNLDSLTYNQPSLEKRERT